ncbi:MAG: 16S rRNA (guanine(527)-N(7))-methyltransferase RsmG [Pseudomonadota bacterium]
MTTLSLSAGLLELGIAASEEQVEQLTAFQTLLEKWNQASNLISRRDIRRIVPRHLLDSVSVLPWVRGERLIDLGSGGGLPGIPLAVLRPRSQVVVLDRSEKKCRFLSTAVRELGLSNVQVVALDVENYEPEARFETLLSRAVAPPARIWSLGRRLLDENGRMVLHAHVGLEADEPGEFPGAGQVQKERVQIPELPESHEVLIIETAVH